MADEPKGGAPAPAKTAAAPDNAEPKRLPRMSVVLRRRAHGYDAGRVLNLPGAEAQDLLNNHSARRAGRRDVAIAGALIVRLDP